MGKPARAKVPREAGEAREAVSHISYVRYGEGARNS